MNQKKGEEGAEENHPFAPFAADWPFNNNIIINISKNPLGSAPLREK